MFIPSTPLLSIISCPSLSTSAPSLIFNPVPVFVMASNLSLFFITPLTFNLPASFVMAALPLVFVRVPLIVIPPSPVFKTNISPVLLVTVEFSSIKIPSAPVLYISRFPFVFVISAS